MFVHTSDVCVCVYVGICVFRAMATLRERKEERIIEFTFARCVSVGFADECVQGCADTIVVVGIQKIALCSFVRGMNLGVLSNAI
jgi:hypothetical protein